MVKVSFIRDDEGFITAVNYDQFGEEIDQSIVNKIIPNITKFDGETLSYRYEFELDADGYIVSSGTSIDGNMVLTKAQADSIIYGASKLVDGEIVVDTDKQQELADEAKKPIMSPQEIVNIQLTKQLAETKQQLATATSGVVALTKMVAGLKGAN